MITAAIVGLGWWGQHILSTVQGQSDKLQFSHGIDLRSDELTSIGEQHGVKLLASLDAVLADPKIDALVLATPHSLHEEQILAAAMAGKHVFCEKPLALTRSSAERAVIACKNAGTILGIGHERRFEPAMQEIKRMVGAGELGAILHVESSFSHDKLKDMDPSDWRADDVESPAAAMTATGIHLTDAYLSMFGPITRVFAQTARRVMCVGGGDVTSVQFEFASGMTGYFSSVLATPFFSRYRVFGEEAWVEATDTSHPQEQTVAHLMLQTSSDGPTITEISPIDTVRANLEAFAEAAVGIAAYPISDWEKIANIAVLEAVVESVARRQPVEVS